jgi:hypothetical protein
MKKRIATDISQTKLSSLQTNYVSKNVEIKMSFTILEIGFCLFPASSHSSIVARFGFIWRHTELLR